MTPGFQPTPHQTGHAIGSAVFILTSKFWSNLDAASLRDANLAEQQFQAELLLLGASAAMHAIESAGLMPDTELAVVSGVLAWAHELPPSLGELLISELDVATDMYAESSAFDNANPRSITELADIEEAFAERLLALGDKNETRGQACIRMSVVVPKILWPALHSSAMQMLQQAGLLQMQSRP